MSTGHHRAWAWALSLSFLVCAAPAAAEPDAATRAAARQLAEDGVMALQNGDAATAAQKLEKAHRALQVPSVALWSARALAKLGSLVEARERYIEATRLPASGDKAVQEQAKLDAQAESEQLTRRIPSLRVDVAGSGGPGLRVTLDGKELPDLLLGEERPTNPGPHRLIATQGDHQASASVALAEGEHRTVRLELSAAKASVAPAPAPAVALAPDRSGNVAETLGWVTLAVGGAGLATGGVTGIVALNKKRALDDDQRCQGGKCLYSAESDVSSLRAFRSISTVGFVAGGVLCGAGVTLLLTSPGAHPAEQSARWSLTVGPAAVGMRGSF